MSSYKPVRAVGVSPNLVDPWHPHRRRVEHWHIDNQIYFITARCRDRLPAFEAEDAKLIFWRQLEIKAAEHGLTLIIASLLNNHYHLLGYLKEGDQLTPLMRGLHGSVARYVNQVTPPEKQVKPLFREATGKQYFDGAIRSPKQFDRTFRYIERQGVRHGLCERGEIYRHTRVYVDKERAIKRALQINAFLTGVGDRKRPT